MTGEQDEPGRGGPFDVETVRALVRLMGRHDVNEIDLTDGESRIRLRRGLPAKAAPVVQAAVPAAPAAAPPPGAEAPAAAPEPAKKLIDITSPIVGTFYSQAKPDQPAFVSAGSRVEPKTVVCIVEAMKLFNDIQAECSGVIAEVCVENAQPVEFGTVLFRVDPAG